MQVFLKGRSLKTPARSFFILPVAVLYGAACNIAQNRYLIGKIDITNLNIALKEKDDARRNYILALKSFWIAYYELRRLTLFDFAAKQMLYTPDDKNN